MNLILPALLSASLFFQPSAHLCKREVAESEFGRQAHEEIRVLPVKRTPEPETAILALQVPKLGQAVGGNPVWIQARVDGFALEADSQFDRASEIVNSKLGQTIHVVIDDKPYFPINGPSVDPFNEQGWYYDQFYKFTVPFKLANGLHTIRMFLARSYGESLKGQNMFFAGYFFIGDDCDASEASILTKPYLTYNEPSNKGCLLEGKPILLDFYVTNTELSPDGYKVKMVLDGEIERIFTSWQPYYIYGLKRGKHSIRLQLIDRKGQVVAGSFNDVQESFTVY